MLLRTKGKALNVKKHLVGKVTRDFKNLNSETFLIVDEQISFTPKYDFIGILTKLPNFTSDENQLIVYNIPNLDHLNEGDIVSVGIDGNINTLYRVNSFHNVILATERCNSNCLMCSQPPKDKNDIPHLFSIYEKLIPLIPKDCFELGISGGEPTLMGDYFFKLLDLINYELPDTQVHILTNGRSFAWNSLAEKLGSIDNSRIMLGIPVYSDYYQVHDYIVQAENAFYQTITGLHNLNRYNIRLEIRIVLHKLTIPRLTRLAKYIYKNLPFVEHVAFMGLEYTGYTPHNIEKLWIDPYDYQKELSESVELLAEKGLRVSIYNTPLCLLPDNLLKYSVKSISDWKNEYLTECSNCEKLTECGGLFRWNLKMPSKYIKPFS
jgi:His-Xaa-Ser system radical SAM maturase HxsC